MTVFALCDRTVGLVRGHRLDNTWEAQINALDYQGLIDAHAQEEAVTCVRHFPDVRDSLLHSYPWIFARKSAALAQLADTLTGWAYSYALPADCIKLLGLVWRGHDLPTWEQAGTTVGCEHKPIAARYTSKSIPVDLWPPLFADAMVFRLAGEICVAVQGNISALSALSQQFQATVSEAYRIGAIDERAGLPLEGYAWDRYSRDAALGVPYEVK